MSDDAYCLGMMQRALARDDSDLRSCREIYEARARVLAARLIAGLTQV
ncbi:hypothetical protein R70006_06211 [Paraburkholderia domus]|nr:hypothetical protein [Paraburkholderia domus]MBK5052843.1 hypothetical protein [Burkholderia sp. R-70006]CAE6821308.1 hypothetical protein R70006_06211 [Paraburkholderia domus]